MADFPNPELFWDEQRAPELWRKIAQSVRSLLIGKSNNHATVTLTVDTTTTEILRDFITQQTIATLSPLTANAAAALATTWVVTTLGKVTIHHVSASTTGRTFGVVLVG